MRHEHLVVTVEAGIKERIDDDLDGGESLESWVADAIEQKLTDDEPERPDPRRAGGEPPTSGSEATGRERDSGFGTSDDARNRRTSGGGDDGRGGDAFDRDRDDGFGESDGGDDYEEGFEYVDDCSI